MIKRMGWHPGKAPAGSSYAIYDELYAPNGQRVAVLEVFSDDGPCYCNALTPAGVTARIGVGSTYEDTRDWAERVAGLKPDIDLIGRPGGLKRRT
jgi:hypothetical protein